MNGDADLTERTVFVGGKGLGALCRRGSIAYSRQRRPLGVIVPAGEEARLRHLIADRDRRDQEAKQRTEAVARARAERREEFRRRFPAASEETVERYEGGHCVYSSMDEAPLSFLTAEGIADLRLVTDSECGVCLSEAGAMVMPLFGARVPEETGPFPKDSEVHARATEIGFPPHKALWALNKLVKIVASPAKSDVYAAKDRLLAYWSEYLIDGRISRDESKPCWSCTGGTRWSGEDCERCEGTGYYSERVLYEVRYKFPGDERVYCFHTYTEPPLLAPEPGADKAVYGYRFTADERRSIPFGFWDLLRILRHEIKLRRLAEEARRQAAEHEERNRLVERWAALGLPPMRADATTDRLRDCLRLVGDLSA